MPSFLEQINNRAADNKAAEKAAPAPDGAESDTVESEVHKETKEKTPAKKDEGLKGIKSTEHETQVESGYLKKRLLTILLCAGLLFLLIGGVWFTVYSLRLVKVVDFTGRTLPEMEKWADECGLNVDGKKVYDEKIPDGTIISQEVAEGKKLPPKAVIEVTVSKGPDPDKSVELPELESMTAPQIKKWIDDNKLTAVRIVEENSETVEKGSVIRVEYDSVATTKDNFRRGDGMNIYISKGKAVSNTMFKMPDLTGKSQADIESWASEKKIKATYKEVLSDSVPKGYAVSQSIAKDTTVDAGTSVEFEISAGAGVIVPDYSRYLRDEAESVDPDIAVTKKNVYSTKVAYGGLISQSVAPGTRLQQNELKIELVYSLGEPFLPALTGKSESEIPELFYDFNSRGANFTYTITYVDSYEPKGTIVWASNESEYVSLSENISLCVSKGNLVPSVPEQLTPESG